MSEPGEETHDAYYLAYGTADNCRPRWSNRGSFAKAAWAAAEARARWTGLRETLLTFVAKIDETTVEESTKGFEMTLASKGHGQIRDELWEACVEIKRAYAMHSQQHAFIACEKIIAILDEKK